MRLSISALLAALLVTSACSDPPPAHDNTWHPTLPDEGGASLDPRAVGRQPRRLSVTQLDRSLPVVFGRKWIVDPLNIEALPFIARILGQPDYLVDTVETLDPSPIFAKFMDNMASAMCTEAVMSDRTRAEADRVVTRWPDDLPRTLRYLRLRFHGIYVPPGSTEGLEALTQLFNDVKDSTDPNFPIEWRESLPWIGVCVAMTTDPEFMIY